MSTHERPRLTRRDAEHLLDDPASSSSALGHVLAAASASQARDGGVTSGNTPTGPTTVDPAREDAAVAAFVAARLAPSTIRLGSGSMALTGRRAARRAVLATAALVSVTTGGLALAATGHLPTLPDQASDRATDAVAQRGPSESSSTATTASTDAATTATESGTVEGTETEDTTGPTPTPNLAGLCKAFQASDKSAHGKSLDSAAFTALATAAGGKANIATYCVSLVGEPKPKPAKPTQAATGKPTAKPSQAATGKPSAKPSPTGRPTDAGKPTDKPSRSGKGKPEGVGKR